MPAVNPVIEWLQDPVKAAAAITLVGGALVGLVVKLAVGLNTARREARVAAADVPVAPLPLPHHLPAPPQTAGAAELQALQARYFATEASLIETQQAITRIRQAMDVQVRAAAKEEGELSAALIQERAENERLRADNTAKEARIAQLEQKGRDLVAQMQRDLANPPSLPPARKLKSVPPLPRGRRDDR